jgi:hypothetical protein
VPHSFSSLCVSDVTRPPTPVFDSPAARRGAGRRWHRVRCFWRTPSDGSCAKSVLTLTAWCSLENTGGLRVYELRVSLKVRDDLAERVKS